MNHKNGVPIGITIYSWIIYLGYCVIELIIGKNVSIWQ
jgi:hypothetical protein